jgi:hypothetical protein
VAEITLSIVSSTISYPASINSRLWLQATPISYSPVVIGYKTRSHTFKNYIFCLDTSASQRMTCHSFQYTVEMRDQRLMSPTHSTKIFDVHCHPSIARCFTFLMRLPSSILLQMPYNSSLMGELKIDMIQALASNKIVPILNQETSSTC